MPARAPPASRLSNKPYPAAPWPSADISRGIRTLRKFSSRFGKMPMRIRSRRWFWDTSNLRPTNELAKGFVDDSAGLGMGKCGPSRNVVDSNNGTGSISRTSAGPMRAISAPPNPILISGLPMGAAAIRLFARCRSLAATQLGRQMLGAETVNSASRLFTKVTR